MDIGTQFNSKGGNILVLTYWSFSDALIQTYTLPYVRMIGKVIAPGRCLYIVTLEKQSFSQKPADFNEESHIEWIPLSYYKFGWVAAASWVGHIFKLLKLIINKRVSFIHCMGTPAGGIGYIISWVTGCRLILDSYEPHAEAMVENGTWAKKGIAFKLLFWLEKKQTESAAFFISPTEGMREYAKEKYGVSVTNFFVKPAGVDLSLFGLNNVKRPEIMSSLGLLPRHIVCVYAGKFGGIYLDQEVFDFFAVAESHWKDTFRVLLLTNTPAEQIYQYCAKSGFSTDKVIIRFVLHKEMPAYLGVADFAITPVKPVPSKRYCTPIKNGEYWALGLPVIIPANISDDSRIIESHEAGAVLYELNETAYIEAVSKIDELMQKPGLRERIRDLAFQYRRFSRAEKIYKQVYADI